jgi:phosphoribosyl-ATP pyrophosphohydrolase
MTDATARPSDNQAHDVIDRLAATIAARRGADPASSYVASLLAKGGDAILKKIGEEATETVMAAKDGDKLRLTAEVADLWFHCLCCLPWARPATSRRAERREGTSGLAKRLRADRAARGDSGETVQDCIFCKIAGRDPVAKVCGTTVLGLTTSTRWRVHFMLVRSGTSRRSPRSRGCGVLGRSG